MKILIVEDEPLLGADLKEGLNECGHEATYESSAENALQILGKIKFDGIITDLHMPGMDGWQFIRELQVKADNPSDPFDSIPICVLTAYSAETIEAGGISYQPVRTFAKPYQQNFYELVLSFFAEYCATDSPRTA